MAIALLLAPTQGKSAPCPEGYTCFDYRTGSIQVPDEYVRKRSSVMMSGPIELWFPDGQPAGGDSIKDFRFAPFVPHPPKEKDAIEHLDPIPFRSRMDIYVCVGIEKNKCDEYNDPRETIKNMQSSDRYAQFLDQLSMEFIFTEDRLVAAYEYGTSDMFIHFPTRFAPATSSEFVNHGAFGGLFGRFDCSERGCTTFFYAMCNSDYPYISYNYCKARVINMQNRTSALIGMVSMSDENAILQLRLAASKINEWTK